MVEQYRDTQIEVKQLNELQLPTLCVANVKSLSAKGRNLYIFSAHLSNITSVQSLFTPVLSLYHFTQNITLFISVLVHPFHSISALSNSPFAFILFLLPTIFLSGCSPTCTLIPFQSRICYHLTLTFTHQTFTIFCITCNCVLWLQSSPILTANLKYPLYCINELLVCILHRGYEHERIKARVVRILD